MQQPGRSTDKGKNGVGGGEKDGVVGARFGERPPCAFARGGGCSLPLTCQGPLLNDAGADSTGGERI